MTTNYSSFLVTTVESLNKLDFLTTYEGSIYEHQFIFTILKQFNIMVLFEMMK